MALKQKFDNVKPDLTALCSIGASCDWPRRATIAEHKADKMSEMLGQILAGLDDWDQVCPACNGIRGHKKGCISFEIAILIKDEC